MGLSDWLSKDAPEKDIPMETTSFSNEMVKFSRDLLYGLQKQPIKNKIEFEFHRNLGAVKRISRNSNAKCHFDQCRLMHVVIPQPVSSTDLTLGLNFNPAGNSTFFSKIINSHNFESIENQVLTQAEAIMIRNNVALP